MFVLVGIGILFASIFVGYTMHGGKVAAVTQISEFIIIGAPPLGVLSSAALSRVP